MIYIYLPTVLRRTVNKFFDRTDKPFTPAVCANFRFSAVLVHIHEADVRERMLVVCMQTNIG
jgi:hypothetical protein